MSTARAAKRQTSTLEHAIASIIAPDQRVIVSDATWEDYDQLTETIGERPGMRVAFDGKDIEIMVVGPRHESLKDDLGQFVHLVAGELLIERRGVGSTTWKRKAIKRGIESDLCYYFDPAKIASFDEASGRQSNDVKDYPNPDLAIEVDLSPSKIDRPSIYAALQVPEFWRVNKTSATIARLGDNGRYDPIASSRFLYVRPDEILRWLIDEPGLSRVLWSQRLREWARTELAPRATA